MLVFRGLLILVHVARLVDDVLDLTWVLHGDLVVALVQGLVSAMLIGTMDIFTVGSVVSMMAIVTILFMFKDRLNIALFFLDAMVEIVELALG